MNKSITKSILLLSILHFSFANLNAQQVSYKITENNLEDKSNFKIRPSISFFIPPTELIDGLPVNFNLESQYFTKAMDFRGGLHYGTFIGASIGGTLHLVDKVKSVNNKFVTSRTETSTTVTTKFFKAAVNMHKVSGPCVDLTVGTLKDAGFYPKLEIGWDFQTYGKAYAEYNGRSIKGNRNGWLSMKYQAVIANVNIDMTDYFGLGAGTSTYTEERKMAVGFQINPSFAYRPWKTSTFYFSMPVGYLKYMGVSKAPDTTPGGFPVLNILLGAQIGI